MRISVVVPTRNSSRTLDACLRSALVQMSSRDELIVIDNWSVDGTQLLARQLGVTLIVGGPERSAQRNQGLQAATGDIVLFVDSDMVLEPGLLDEARTKFQENDRLSAIVIPETSFGSGYWAGVKSLERGLIEGNAEVEAARGFRRDDLVSMGGWDESLLGPEDWELTDRYRAAGKLISRTECRIWHDEGALGLATLYLKKRYYAPSVHAYMKRSPNRKSGLISRFASRTFLKMAFRHPLRTTGVVVLKFTEGLGYWSGIRNRGIRVDEVYGRRGK